MANLRITNGMAMLPSSRESTSGISTFAQASEEYDSDMPMVRQIAATNA